MLEVLSSAINSDKLDFDINASNYVDVKYTSENYYEDSTGFSGIVGSIVGIKESNTAWSAETGNITRDFVGRGYVKVTLNGESYINYAAFASENVENNTRSLKTVASALKSDSSVYESLGEAIREKIDIWAVAEQTPVDCYQITDVSNSANWQLGCWDMTTGLLGNYNGNTRAALKKIVQVEYGKTYTLTLKNNTLGLKFVLREYKADGSFLKSFGTVDSGKNYTPSSDSVKYASLTVYDSTSAYSLIANGTIVPSMTVYDSSTTTTTTSTTTTTAAEVTADGMKIEKFEYLCMNPNNEGKTMTDYAYAVFPKSYSESGTPLRMVIDCHGFGDSPTEQKVSKNFMWDIFLAHQGYLVLIPNGAGYNNLGCPASVDSCVKAYNYALANYNVKDDGVFVNGNSMGGLGSINLVCSGKIPVLAHSLHYPVTSHRRQIYDNTWASRNANDSAYFYYFNYDKYNEAHGNDYKFTTFPFANSSTTASNDELELYNYNFADKIATQDSIWRYCSSFFDYSKKTFKEGYEDFISATDEARVAELYGKVSIDYPVPVLAQHGLTDGSVNCQFTKYFVNAVNRGNGKTAQGIYYNTSVHGVCIGDKATYTCNDGAEYTIAQSGYEMYQFFKANDK